MPSFLLKNLSPDLHQRLKEDATRHHRSMARHVVAILEGALGGPVRRELPPPVKAAFLITDEFMDKAKRWGRA